MKCHGIEKVRLDSINEYRCNMPVNKKEELLRHKMTITQSTPKSGSGVIEWSRIPSMLQRLSI